MVDYKENFENKRIFIVGELPEELSSYRHLVARLLNVTSGDENSTCDSSNLSKGCGVYSFTGDIGLHINLALTNNKKLEPKIRCTYCNYNNETVLRKKLPHYHSPDNIHETILKRLDSRMIYLCTTYDHHPENKDKPYDFLSSPNIRVI